MHRTMFVLALSLTAASALAQTTGTDTPLIDAREARQSARIQQGTATGALTPAETARLDRGQARLQSTEAAARADGTVTNAERAVIAKEQNRQSCVIKRLKHNKRTTTPSAS